MTTTPHPAQNLLRTNPLVPAAVLFLLGIASSPFLKIPTTLALALAIISWATWFIAESLRKPTPARLALAFLLLSLGTATFQLNQSHIEPTHIARFTTSEESPITLRASVLAPPASDKSFGNSRWLAHATEILTTSGWLPTTGDVLIASPPSSALKTGTTLELYGWLARPQPALNPGTRNPQKSLAADRIFAQVRIPRPSGLILLDATSASPLSPLTRFRLFLRAKLLDHTLRENVPAAYTLTALLLGYRDPAISSVSQAFADAGVAHLLAISGSHIVFFTLIAWQLLRLFPLRPRTRELLIAALVSAYVLATPCGPPIVRAAVVLVMVFLARLLGRPRHYLNMLAAAAILVVLIRPADIADAGFQLSFITTAGLVLLSPRVHTFLFEARLARTALIADLANTRTARLRAAASRYTAGLASANIVGALTAAPLVAFHFGQINLWAAITGLLALPIVWLAMIIGALQLAAEVISPFTGALLAPLAAYTGRALIWIIQQLASLPGAALALRPPPPGIVILLYAALLLTIARRRLNLSRAAAVNLTLATLALSATWYTLTLPLNHLRLTSLSVGQGNCILIRTPRGDLFTIDAGSPQGSSLAAATLTPALRLEGARTLTGEIFTALDVSHARHTGEIISTFHPRSIWLAQPTWQTRGQTLAGASIKSATDTLHIPIHSLAQNQSIDFGDNCTAEILWPPAQLNPLNQNPLKQNRLNQNALNQNNLILLFTFANHHILIADPAALRPHALVLLDHPTLHADAILLTGPQRGTADDPLRRILAPLHPQHIIWSGRGPWVPAGQSSPDLNTADGALTLDLDATTMHLQKPR